MSDGKRDRLISRNDEPVYDGLEGEADRDLRERPLRQTLYDADKFRDPNQRWCVVSWVENRHPREKELLKEYARQQSLPAEELLEIPTKDIVNPDILVPRVAIKVSQCFGEPEEAEDYAQRLWKATDFNVCVPEMNAFKVYPPLDGAKGTWREDPLNEILQGFYEDKRKSAKDIVDRIMRDKEAARNQPEREPTTVSPTPPTPAADLEVVDVEPTPRPKPKPKAKKTTKPQWQVVKRRRQRRLPKQRNRPRR